MKVLSNLLSRSIVPLLLGAVLCSGAGMSARAEDPTGKTTTYSVNHSLTVKEIPQGAKQVRIWFWLPQEDVAQQLLNLTVAKAPGKYSIQRDPTYGSRYLYCEVSNPTTDSVSLMTEFLARRSELKTPLQPEKVTNLSSEQKEVFAEQLRKDLPNMEVTANIQKLADQICGQETGIVRQARLLYDYVIDHAEHYSKGPNAPKSSQIGSAEYCLVKGGGACTDLHALFIALARARNIPTRLCFGSRLQPQNEGKETDPGYRCWILFFSPGQGWIPCDLAAGDTVADKRDFYFGGLDDRRLVFNEGRNLTLAPAQTGPPINLVIGAYVEVDGKPHTGFERRLKYTEVK